MTDDRFALGRRAGLPDDLALLLRAHPRETWEGRLGDVGRFWLQRHGMFRELCARLTVETRGFAAAPDAPGFGPRFARLAGFLLGELETHHMVEDHHYFPRLARIEPRLDRGFALLDADHHALHDALEATGAQANALLAALRGGAAAHDAAARAADAIERLGGLLDRHLADEEDIVAPILIAHGEARLG